jgi:hypothetical protein
LSIIIPVDILEQLSDDLRMKPYKLNVDLLGEAFYLCE